MTTHLAIEEDEVLSKEKNIQQKRWNINSLDSVTNWMTKSDTNTNEGEYDIHAQGNSV